MKLLWEPKSFCICFDTKNASLILGTLRLIGGILGILSCLLGTLSCQVTEAGMKYLPNCVQDPSGIVCQEQLQKTIFMLTMAVLSRSTIESLVSIMLIHGVRKAKSLLMIPYLAYGSALIIFHIVGSIIAICYYSQYIAPLPMFTGVMTLALMIFLETACILVVRSHHNEVSREVVGKYNKLQEA